AVSAVVNGGNIFEPYLAEEFIDPVTKEVVAHHEPQLKGRVISEETSKEMRETLEAVVANGTGRPAYVDGYRVGGKTGTAQKVGEGGQYMANNHIVSFIGFAPADDPEIVVLVAIDNPKNTIHFEGVVAAPIVVNIILDSLKKMKRSPHTTGLKKKYKWLEKQKLEVPELIRIKKQEIIEELSNFSLDVHGHGDYVKDQSPKPGTKIKEGETIRIYLSNK